MCWRFTVFIKGLDQFTDAQANALYGGGCDDGTVASGCGRAWVGFGRIAPTLQAAIASAIANIRAVGLEIDHVEIDEEDLTPAALAQWEAITPVRRRKIAEAKS